LPVSASAGRSPHSLAGLCPHRIFQSCCRHPCREAGRYQQKIPCLHACVV